MTDHVTDSVIETGTVMTELVAKAREARSAGRSRRDFFATTAKLAGATALGAAGIDLMQPIAARAATTSMPSSDTAQEILNIACTAESLAICFYYAALQRPDTLPLVNNTANRNYFQAALSQETEHLFYLQDLGGMTLATKFYFPDNMFIDEGIFFKTASTLEDYFISAYLAAALDFSGVYSSGFTTPSPKLIGSVVQIVGVECEHRALLNVAANVSPPNNRIAETALLTSVSAAVAPLTGFITPGTAGFNPTPHSVPLLSTINTAAAPYGTSFFPKPIYV
jgi:hypothetical protein